MKGHVLLFFCIATLSLEAEERVLQLGGAGTWNTIESLVDVEIERNIQGFQYLTLSSKKPSSVLPDLWLPFDEVDPDKFSDVMGQYVVTRGGSVLRAHRSQSRFGSGAAHFVGGELRPTAATAQRGLSIKPGPGALFASDSCIQDFSIDFWLYPANLGKGEQILSWSSERKTAGGTSLFQRIRCQVGSNSLEWTFTNFFTSVDDNSPISFHLRGIEKILPQTWSHHMVRYDARQGLLEYLVNGNVEAVVYTTKSQRPDGEIYTPKTGIGGLFILGEGYSGIIDNFRIFSAYIETGLEHKYPLKGGFFVTKPLDMNYTDSQILKVIADVRIPKEGAVPPQIELFIRTANNPYQWIANDFSSWTPIENGKLLGHQMKGRYVQIKVHMYPSDTGESSPILKGISIFYEPDVPPPPPSMVQAKARNGAVELLWKPSPDRAVAGYVVYYGTDSGTYFGFDAILGPSPLDVGLRTSIVIDGLQNGRVYYFSVAAYNKTNPGHIGALSREVAARPLRME